MKCPVCGSTLEQETYYSHVDEDTSYFNYCPKCEWDDYPYDTYPEREVEEC